jgi:hypothetical protein
MKIGILIIGSLWWRTGLRESWRTAQLNRDGMVRVKLPIRYGRKSAKGTYTMTLGPAGTEGTAMVVPCLREGGGDAVHHEAEKLWEAESNGKSEPGSIAEDWGSVGALFREGASPTEIGAWSAYFRSKGGTARYMIDDKGLLTVPWPQRIDGLTLDYDVLLATATEEKDVTTPDRVAEAWICHREGQEEYFFENIRAGIRTQQDEAIWRRMVTELAWIKGLDARFGPAIETLRHDFPTRTVPTVRYFAPERWGTVDRFAHFYSSTYSFPEKVHARVVGTSAHFERAELLRQIAHDMIPQLQLDRAELEAKGFTHAEHSRRLTAIVESSITSLYSSLDCGRQVVTHVFAKYRGLPDSTRKTFQRAAEGRLDPQLPAAILNAFANAPWYPKFCHLRDALTHGGPGSCHRDEQTGKIMYFHEAVRSATATHIPDIFAVLDENFRHVNLFLGQIFKELLETLKDDEVQ